MVSGFLYISVLHIQNHVRVHRESTVRPVGNYLRTFCIGGWDRLQEVYQIVCRFASETHLELSGYAYKECLNEMSLQKRENYITMITVGCNALTATELHSTPFAP